MSNNNQPNKQNTSNISPMFTIPPPSTITSMPPPPSPAAFYQSYIQAAAMYALHQQQFFQQMVSVPPPCVSTSNIPARTNNVNRPSLPVDNNQRRSMGKIYKVKSLDTHSIVFIIVDVRQTSNSKNDYQDRKRNFTSSSSRDNNNKHLGNKRSYSFDQLSRNDDRNIPRRDPPLSPVSKRRRTNNITIEDEYHEYEN